MPAILPSALPAFAHPSDDLAAIAFDGPDAATFLHGQLSTDVTTMPVGTVGPSTWNSPKGRVLASLELFRRASDAFVALVPADLAPALRKRFAMFVLRAKVVVSDATAGRALVGIGGDGTQAVLARAFGVVPAAGHGATVSEGDLLMLPDGRAVLLCAADAVPEILTRLALPPGDTDAFTRAGIRAGAPLVTAATQDQFVPQALNFDLTGAVHFRKGCYPGQEIVARMQYLGRLKERLFAFRVDAPSPDPGTPLFAAGVAEPALGKVVNAATADTGSEFLAVANYDAAVEGTLRLGTPDGPPLERLALPYDVPVPVAPQRVKL